LEIFHILQKLPDPLNYGLFSNDLGYFFQEQKFISEYVNKGQVAFCEVTNYMLLTLL